MHKENLQDPMPRRGLIFWYDQPVRGHGLYSSQRGLPGKRDHPSLLDVPLFMLITVCLYQYQSCFMKEVCCLLLLSFSKRIIPLSASNRAREGAAGVWANNEKTNVVIVTAVLDVSS